VELVPIPGSDADLAGLRARPGKPGAGRDG
jgi:hypothetical protein